MYEEFGRAMIIMAVLSVLAIPLIIWKLIEIIIWLFNHIKIV